MPQDQIPWWVDRFAVPVFFTFFGVLLGFAFGRLKDWLDEHKAKESFLRSVRVELLTIRDHLQGTLKNATENIESLKKGNRNVVYLVTSFHTSVYTSQLSKLRDLSDPRVFEIARFYDDLSNLEKIKSHHSSASFDLTRLTEQDTPKEGPLVGLYTSALNEIVRRIEGLLPAANTRIAILPHQN